MTKYQPQVYIKNEWRNCETGRGLSYGPFQTKKEAEDILRFYHSGRGITQQQYRIKEISEEN